MHRNLTISSHALLLGVLAFPASGCLRAQSNLPEKTVFSPAHPQKDRKPGVPGEPEREGAESGSAADRDPEMERMERELNRELMRARQTLVREAMVRVREGKSSEFRWVVNQIWPFPIFLVVTGSLLWILRAFLEDSRWRKMVKIQSEMHGKLLEKFGTTQEMLAYMESEAGRRFLESPPFETEHKQAFPYARILWSVQIGLILAVSGTGLLFLRTRVAAEEAGAALLVFGTLCLTLGIGFLLSAGVSYLLSKSFGLLERPRLSEPRASRE